MPYFVLALPFLFCSDNRLKNRDKGARMAKGDEMIDLACSSTVLSF